MLSEKDWLIAKKLISISNQGDDPKNPDSLILLLNKLLSCYHIHAYTLIHQDDTRGATCTKGIKAIQESPGKVTVKPIPLSTSGVAKQLQESGKNAFPQLLEESKQSGAACKVRSSGNTVYAYVMLQHEMSKAASPLQLLLKFSPVAELCYQRVLLLETLLPPVSVCLHEYFFSGHPNNPLTDRERQVLGMIASGNRAYQVACALNISERTVNFHLGRIYRKLGARNRQQAIYAAQRTGALTISGRGVRSLREEEIFDIGGGFGQHTRYPHTIFPRVGASFVGWQTLAYM